MTIRLQYSLWHDAAMISRHFLLTVALLVTGTALADVSRVPVTFRVVAADGASLRSIDVRFGAQSLPVADDGRVVMIPAGKHPIQIRVSADDYYSMIHTLSPNQQGLMADIELVRKTSDRRLFIFAGDAMLARRYLQPRAGETTLVRPSNVLDDGQKMLRFIKPYVELADIASVNMETQLADTTPAEKLAKSVTFYSPPELATLLEWTGFDYVALGNNHMFDYRDAGIRSTFRALEKTKLGYSGAGLNENEARRPYETTVNDARIAFLSYVGWSGTFKPSQTAAANKGGAALGDADVFAEDAAKIDASTVAVLQLHSGLEYAEKPAMTEITSLRTAVEAGIDIAVGHHSHVVQGLEIYRDKLIAYSMGNFLFDQYIYSTQSSMLLYVWMDGDELYRAEIVPLNINGYVPTPASGAFRHSVLNRIARLSREFGTCMKSSGSHAVIGDAIECTSSQVSLADAAAGTTISLWKSGIPAVNALRVDAGAQQYRVGSDLLPRGDFESAGQLGVPVRAFLTGKQVQMVSDDTSNTNVLKISMQDERMVRTGMKVFERAFRLSNPATVSGRVRANGAARLRVYLQRRTATAGFEEALQDGPLTLLGETRLTGDSWQAFVFNHNLPRLATKGVRIVIDVKRDRVNRHDAEIYLDDLAWIEWHTPWLGAEVTGPLYGTHVQARERDSTSSLSP